MTEKVLWQDIVSDVNYNEEEQMYVGSLVNNASQFLEVMTTYVEDYSDLKVQIQSNSFNVSIAIDNDIMWLGNKGSAGSLQYMPDNPESEGDDSYIIINFYSGELKDGDVVKIVIEEDDPQPKPSPLNLNTKTPLERIAEALETYVGIEHTDIGSLDTKDYLERIADACEKLNEQGG